MSNTTVSFEFIVIFALVLLNGLLAMSEIAIISARKTRLEERARNGDAGARTALELANDPSRFLAAVQVGITLVGILAGAFGGATLAGKLQGVLNEIPWLARQAEAISVAVVVIAISLLSIVLGELVPKRFALAHAESVASIVSRPMRLIALIASPIVRFLGAATDLLLKLLRVKTTHDSSVTEEEVKMMIEQGAEAGIFEQNEGTMMKRALAFGDRRASELMTQRLKVVSIDLSAPVSENIATIAAAPHTYFPAYEDSPDNVVGVVSNKCILETMLRERRFEIDLRACVSPALYVAETMTTMMLLERFKETGHHLAVVVDEYGTPIGIITLTDMMEAIVGDLPGAYDMDDQWVIHREDGSFLIDGLYTIHDLVELLRIAEPYDEFDGNYQTLGGFVMARLGHIPRAGEVFEWSGYRFEVVDMDGRRVDKVLISSLPSPEAPSTQPS